MYMYVYCVMYMDHVCSGHASCSTLHWEYYTTLATCVGGKIAQGVDLLCTCSHKTPEM